MHSAHSRGQLHDAQNVLFSNRHLRCKISAPTCVLNSKVIILDLDGWQGNLWMHPTWVKFAHSILAKAAVKVHTSQSIPDTYSCVKIENFHLMTKRRHTALATLFGEVFHMRHLSYSYFPDTYEEPEWNLIL